MNETPEHPKVPLPAAAPAPPYGAPLRLADAQAAMAAAETEARRNGWAVAIAIVDSAGHLVLLQKLDGAQHSSVEVALGKARTAVNFRRPTKHYEDAITAGGNGLKFLGMPGMVPFEGGLPIVVSGAVTGAIGVSGVRSDCDTAIATAALRALVGSEEA